MGSKKSRKGRGCGCGCLWRGLEVLLLLACLSAILLFFYSLLLGPTDVLIMGVDERPGQRTASRADALLAVRADPWKGVAMLSIPRDLWVVIPGYGENRINAAPLFGESQGGGANLTKLTVTRNLGVPVNYYAKLNFSGFRELIDAMGGIEVEVERPIRDDQYPTNNYGVTTIYIPAGVQWMDGEKALQYVRTRHQSSDFDRAKRQQQVIMAMRERLLRPDIAFRLPLILAALGRSVESDIPLPNLILTSLALLRGEIHRYAIDQDSTNPWITPEGASVLLPDTARIRGIVQSYLKFSD